MSGCVNYSRRFYDEVLQDPATASPLIFPETVFNAPASHLAGYFASTAMDYTLVGDPCSFLQGTALAADWLETGLWTPAWWWALRRKTGSAPTLSGCSARVWS